MGIPFKRSRVAIATTVATMLANQGAHAQTADVQQLETVTVQGLRQSLEKAQEAKRNAGKKS